MLLIKANLAGDMRRLHAAEGAPFADVRAQVHALFAGDQPAGTTFAYAFTDEDGDQINIKHDADWRECLAYYQGEGKAVRVNVAAVPAAVPGAVPAEGPAATIAPAVATTDGRLRANRQPGFNQDGSPDRRHRANRQPTAAANEPAANEPAANEPAAATIDAAATDATTTTDAEGADTDTMAGLKATLDEIAERVNAGDVTFISAAQEVFAAGRASVDAAITQCAESDVGRTIKDVYANVSELCEEQLAAFGQAVKERRERRQANGGRRGHGPCGRGRRGPPGQFRGFGPGAMRGLGLNGPNAHPGQHPHPHPHHNLGDQHGQHGKDHHHHRRGHGKGSGAWAEWNGNHGGNHGGHHHHRRRNMATPATAVPAAAAGDILPDGEISLGSHGPGVVQIKEALTKAFGFPDDYFRKNPCFGRRVMSTVANLQADANLEPTGVYNAAVKAALIALLANHEDHEDDHEDHDQAPAPTATATATAAAEAGFFATDADKVLAMAAAASADAIAEGYVTVPTAPTAPAAAATFPFETSPVDVDAAAAGLFDVEAPPSPTTGRKWHQELTQLEEMGFGATDVNLTLLDLHGGDVGKVVSTFLV